MKRVREYHRVLNRLLRHEGLNPNRALLGVVLGMWTDADTDEERKLLEGLLQNVWSNPNRVRWTDPDDNKLIDPANSNTDKEATELMKGMFSNIMRKFDEREE